MKYFSITFLFSMVIIKLFAQNKHVFLEDSLYYRENVQKTAGDYPILLNDSLDDGTWFLYNVYRKDSGFYNDEKIIMTGTFLNYQKNGVFIIFNYDQYDKSKISEYKTYKNNELNGLSFYRLFDMFYKEINYLQGKKHGLEVIHFLSGPYQGLVQEIRYYSFDTLMDWKVYNGTYLIYHGIGNDTIFNIDMYDKRGQIVYNSDKCLESKKKHNKKTAKKRFLDYNFFKFRKKTNKENSINTP